MYKCMSKSLGEVLLISWNVSISTDLNVVYMYLATSICIIFLSLDPLLFLIRFLKILFLYLYTRASSLDTDPKIIVLWLLVICYGLNITEYNEWHCLSYLRIAIFLWKKLQGLYWWEGSGTLWMFVAVGTRKLKFHCMDFL